MSNLPHQPRHPIRRAALALCVAWALVAALAACGEAAAPAAAAPSALDGAAADVGGASDAGVALGTACTSDQACADQPQPASACLAWRCQAGTCQLAAVAAGKACVGASRCVEYACDGQGGCVGGAPVTCPDGLCSAGVCEPTTGQCSLAPVAAGIACSDLNPCTLKDVCDGAGHCLGGAPLACQGSACAPQACSAATGACTAAPAPSGQGCEDGNPCTLADTCDGKGSCAPGLPPDCGGGPCWTGVCQPATGACTALAKPATTGCDDGVACTAGDSCANGQCQGGPWICACQLDGDCDDANPCTADACAAGSCVQAPVDASPCSDGSACTAADACVAGQCLPGAATNCDDGNACTADSCLAASGSCAFAPLSELACGDGDPCTLADSCAAGVCKGGEPKQCSATAPCQSASCDGQSGLCVAVDLAGPCTGTDACVVGQTCQAGQCGGGVAVDCDDANPCTQDGCQPASGLCLHTLLADGAACGNHQACLAGVCNCVLGAYGLPAEVTEALHSVQATDQGFVVAGQAMTAAGGKGLVAKIGWGNQVIWQHRPAGPGGAALEFASVAGLGAGFQLAATAAGKEAVRWRLDALGNAIGQDLAAAPAEAQALVALSDGAAVVATELWAQGAATRVVRLPASGPALWTAVILPSSPQDAARAHSAVAVTGELWVAGHDVPFAAPALSVPWVARLSLVDGKVISKQMLATGVQGGLLFAALLHDNQLWLAGQVQAPPLGPGPAALLQWLPLGQDGSAAVATQLPLELGKASLAGLASSGATLVAAGWRSQKTLDTVVVGVQAGQLAWSYAPTEPEQQSLAAVTALADGTLVAVGSRAVGATVQGYWLRMAANGAVACQ